MEHRLKVILSGRNKEALQKQSLSSGFQFEVVDLQDIKSLKKLLQQGKLLIHCAGPFQHTAETMTRIPNSRDGLRSGFYSGVGKNNTCRSLVRPRRYFYSLLPYYNRLSLFFSLKLLPSIFRSIFRISNKRIFAGGKSLWKFRVKILFHYGPCFSMGL
jgi:hypothetical protein